MAGMPGSVASFLGDARWQVDCAATPPAKAECDMPVSAGSEWTLAKILKLSRQQVIDRWSAAPPAAVGELDGEYIGLAPNAGDASAAADIDSRLYNESGPLGYWLGKSYKPAAQGSMMGEGYNRWRHSGKDVEHKLQFATRPGTSLIDQKPAFMMFYGDFNPSSTLTDELRKIDAHVYIGLATQASGSGRTKPDHFVLVGPAAPWTPF